MLEERKKIEITNQRPGRGARGAVVIPEIGSWPLLPRLRTWCRACGNIRPPLAAPAARRNRVFALRRPESAPTMDRASAAASACDPRLRPPDGAAAQRIRPLSDVRPRAH